ncbi:MAG TPA: cell division protein FtsZ [Anaerolineaceae bacterium]|nr:cell division protein FtsZ [Anaerolineaceae bacterium]
MPISSKPASRMPGLPKPPVLKVLGLGGGGCNAISRMIELGLSSVEYIAANTDAQTLKTCLAPTKIQLGPRLTRGLGAGGDPNVGQAAAEESYADLNRALTGADMVFLTAGMGGGTGTGSIPIAARVARNLGAVTIAIVTMPFSFEVGRRQKNAREGLAQLRQYTDTLITVPNDRLLQIAEKNLPLELTFRMADDVLRQGIMGITELITQPGLINVDFAHVRQIMQLGGGSLLAIGTASGPGKAIQAVERALHHPLIESINLENATGIIANFTAGQDLTFMEVADALTFLQSKTTNQADIIPGIIVNDSMGDKVQVILVITGLGATPIDDKPSNPSQPVQKHMEIASEHEVSSHHLLHPEPEPKPQPMAPKSQVEMIASPVDLDVPAFIRRRLR